MQIHVFALVIGFLPWCVNDALAEFQPITFSSREEISFKLSRASHINHQCYRLGDEEKQLPNWKYSIECVFNTLSKSEFDEMMLTYGHWSQEQPKIVYDAERTYFLMDFLPPMMRALNHHRFRQQKKVVSGLLPDLDSRHSVPHSQVETIMATNCWGTTYEILRHASLQRSLEVHFFVSDLDPMFGVLRGRSDFIKHADADALGKPREIHSDLNPGDLLLIYHSVGGKEYLDHTLILIDEGLYFEKAGSGDKVPFRLVDFKTLTDTWRGYIFDYEYRRPRLEGPWEDPKSLFNLSHPTSIDAFPVLDEVDEELSRHFAVSILYEDFKPIKGFYSWNKSFSWPNDDELGRAHLPEEALRPFDLNAIGFTGSVFGQ